MGRLTTKQLTERELEIMHVFWDAPDEQPTVVEVRDRLSAQGRDLAITTVATMISILVDKKHLKQTGDTRPHGYRALHTKEVISGSILGDLVDRVFGGSTTALLKCLSEQKGLTKKERARLERLVQDLEE